MIGPGIKKIAIIGASKIQLPVVLRVNDMGYESHVFAWEEGNAVNHVASAFYPISILEKELILEKCLELKIDAIITVGSDIALDTVNYIAHRMGLVGNSLESTLFTRDKHAMRDRLGQFGLPIPRYALIQSDAALAELGFSFPFMIKASDRSGSRGISLVHDMDEAIEAYNDAKSVSFNQKVLAEEYFDGKQYSLEFLSQNGDHKFIGLTEEFYTGPPQFVEKGHLMPGRIKEEFLKSAIDLSYKALIALEINNGASHIELRINDNGEICFIEIAGRMGGDFRSELIRLAYNYDYISDTVKIALGEKVNLRYVPPIAFAFIKWLINPKDVEDYQVMKEKFEMDTVELPAKFDYKERIESSSDRLGFYIASSDKLPSGFLELID